MDRGSCRASSCPGSGSCSQLVAACAERCLECVPPRVHSRSFAARRSCAVFWLPGVTSERDVSKCAFWRISWNLGSWNYRRGWRSYLRLGALARFARLNLNLSNSKLKLKLCLLFEETSRLANSRMLRRGRMKLLHFFLIARNYSPPSAATET